MLQLLYESFIRKLLTSPHFKIYTLKETYDFTFCLQPCPAARVSVMSGRRWGNEAAFVGLLVLEPSAIDSAIDASSRMHTGQRGTFCADNMLIEWAFIEEVKQCYKLVDCIFQIGWQFTKLSQKFTQLCLRGLVKQLQHF